MLLNQQAKKGVTVLSKVIDPAYQGELELLLHSGGKEEDVWKIGDLLVLQCPVIKDNEKL